MTPGHSALPAVVGWLAGEPDKDNNENIQFQHTILLGWHMVHHNFCTWLSCKGGSAWGAGITTSPCTTCVQIYGFCFGNFKKRKNALIVSNLGSRLRVLLHNGRCLQSRHQNHTGVLLCGQSCKLEKRWILLQCGATWTTGSMTTSSGTTGSGLFAFRKKCDMQSIPQLMETGIGIGWLW